jgi:threonine aldolase
MDGSRISNAAISLNKDFREFTRDAGVDVLSFGGTKNGMMFGEAVIFFKQELATDFKFIRKQGMQLHSKMRFIGVQFEALLSNDCWKRNAAHANAMAKLLAQKLSTIPRLFITHSVDANGVFVTIPPVNGRGVGLRNTRERLTVLYGDRHRIDVVDVAPGLRVEMRLPLEI